MRFTGEFTPGPNGHGIQVTKTSDLTGRSHTLPLPLTASQFTAGLADWEAGALIQDAFPTLSPAEREFLKTGITDAEWKTAFADEDDGDDG